MYDRTIQNLVTHSIVAEKWYFKILTHFFPIGIFQAFVTFVNGFLHVYMLS